MANTKRVSFSHLLKNPGQFAAGQIYDVGACVFAAYEECREYYKRTGLSGALIGLFGKDLNELPRFLVLDQGKTYSVRIVQGARSDLEYFYNGHPQLRPGDMRMQGDSLLFRRVYRERFGAPTRPAALRDIAQALLELHRHNRFHGHVVGSNCFEREDEGFLVDSGAHIFESGFSSELVSRYREDDLRSLFKLSSLSLADEKNEREMERRLLHQENGDSVKRLEITVRFLEERFHLGASQGSKKREISSRSRKGRLIKLSGAEDSPPEEESPAPSPPQPEQNRKSLLTPLVFLLFIALVVGYFARERFFVAESPPEEDQKPPLEISASWRSGSEERMAAVARAAVLENDRRAQDEILASSLSGEVSGAIVDRLLMSAFQMPWSESYTKEDRRTLFYYAAGKLLQGEEVYLEPFQELHPGVLFSVVSSLPVDTPSAKEFDRELLTHLSALPAPYGTLMDELLKENRSAQTLRAVVHALSGSTDESALQALFQPGSEGRSLALIGRLIGIVPPEYLTRMEHYLRSSSEPLGELLSWFEGNELVDWNEQPVGVRLLLISGEKLPPGLPEEYLADLLRFPARPLREDAAFLLSEKLEDKYGNLVPTLQVLSSPEIDVTREQTVGLVSALLVEPDVQFALLTRWFESQPAPETIVELLLARDQSTEVDPFNSEAVAYIREREWALSFPKLEQLANHPEEVVRLLALQRLDPENRREANFLEELLEQEQSERVRRMIEAKLNRPPPMAPLAIPE